MKYSFTQHFAAMYSLNFKLKQTDRIMIGLEEQTKQKQDEPTDTKRTDLYQKLQRRAGGAGAGCGE